MFVCEECGDKFTRKNNLERHKKESCRGSKKKEEEEEEEEEEVYIPTFSGSEFGTGKPKSKETIAKIERLVQSRRSRSPNSTSVSRNQGSPPPKKRKRRTKQQLPPPPS